jgi:hypothetical protein
VDLLSRETRETRVVDLETKVVEELGETLTVRLLFVNAEREGFHTAEEEEGVERGEGVSDRVDGEGDSLLGFKFRQSSSRGEWR